MSESFNPDAWDVAAPLGAVAWSVSRGWITSTEEVAAVHREAQFVIYAVPDDGVVCDVVGQASLAAIMHVDRRVLALHREVDELRQRLLDVAEYAAESFASR